MGLLDNFSKEDRDLLVALPYRAGLWVSRCDDTGGAESDEAEINALRGIIMGFAEDFLKSELVEEIMRQTVARRDDWKRWEENTETVPSECTRAVEIVAARLDERNTAFFKRNLMEIAMTVALAYREFGDDQPLLERAKMYLRYGRQRLFAALQKKQALSFSEYLNISREEHRALTQLSAALRTEYREGVALQKPASGAEG